VTVPAGEEPGKGKGRADDLDALEERLGHGFRDREILDQALTHRSATHETGGRCPSNEGLEFLGDAVLGLVVAEMLIASPAAGSEGRMSRIRAALVNSGSLADLGRRLGVGPLLRLGKGEESEGGRDRESILADACEAIIGALYLDGGLEAAARWIRNELAEEMAGLVGGPEGARDPKTSLQELLQAEGAPAPNYLVVEESGPPHRRLYRVRVTHDGRVLGEGEGPSKKAAEQEAARRGLAFLDR
jgi:ribonuclease-3